MKILIFALIILAIVQSFVSLPLLNDEQESVESAKAELPEIGTQESTENLEQAVERVMFTLRNGPGGSQQYRLRRILNLRPNDGSKNLRPITVQTSTREPPTRRPQQRNNVRKCGEPINRDNDTDSYFAKNVNKGELPWAVVVQITDLYRGLIRRCAGTLVSNEVVVTAANCFQLMDHQGKYYCRSLLEESNQHYLKIEVLYGGACLKKNCIGSQYLHRSGIETIETNKYFSNHTCHFSKDIAFIKLKGSIDQRVANPICLPSFGKVYMKKRLTVTGIKHYVSGSDTSNSFMKFYTNHRYGEEDFCRNVSYICSMSFYPGSNFIGNGAGLTGQTMGGKYYLVAVLSTSDSSYQNGYSYPYSSTVNIYTRIRPFLSKLREFREQADPTHDPTYYDEW